MSRRIYVASRLANDPPAPHAEWILRFVSSGTSGRNLAIHVLMGQDGEDRQIAPAMGTIRRGN